MLLSKVIKADQLQDDIIAPLTMENFPEAYEDVVGIWEAIEGDNQGDAISPEDRDREVEVAEFDRKIFEEGYSEGKKEAMEMCRKEMEPIIDRFIKSVDEVNLLKNSLFKDSENEITDLVLAAAKKIIQTEIEIDREVVAAVIKNALKSLTDRKDILIRVNPYDYYLILEHREKFFNDVDNLNDVKFVEDGSVGRGGCLIESRFGEVDARIEKQLELLVKAIKSPQRG